MFQPSSIKLYILKIVIDIIKLLLNKFIIYIHIYLFISFILKKFINFQNL